VPSGEELDWARRELDDPDPRGAKLTVATVPTQLAHRQIADLRGKVKASFILAALADIARPQ